MRYPVSVHLTQPNFCVFGEIAISVDFHLMHFCIIRISAFLFPPNKALTGPFPNTLFIFIRPGGFATPLYYSISSSAVIDPTFWHVDFRLICRILSDPPKLLLRLFGDIFGYSVSHRKSFSNHQKKGCIAIVYYTKYPRIWMMCQMFCLLHGWAAWAAV